MTLQIHSDEIDRLAQELADLTGEPLAEAVAKALRDELAKQREVARVREAVRVISERFMALPVLDARTPDELLGYDDNGLPT